MYVCMYVCMFRHNYLSVNGIVSFSSFTWLYKYKEEYKKNRGFSPLANYTDPAIAAGQRS
jgi:hypothetical protein